MAQYVKSAVMGSKDAKAENLAHVTVEPTKDTRITSDFGTKQTNTDDWLKVNSKDKTGPMLLEDNFGREKVSPEYFRITNPGALASRTQPASSTRY